jgi:DNA-directed RNA polymerase specialized sigma24 family protein
MSIEEKQITDFNPDPGESPTETGQVMGRTPGAVRILQHRALSALRSLLEI